MQPLPSEHHAGFHQLFIELPISVRSRSLGITPASESLVALTKIMNRIVVSPSVFEPG